MNNIPEIYNQMIQYGNALSAWCPGYGYFSGGGPGGYMWYHGPFTMIPLVILLLVAVWLVARNARHKHEASAGSETPGDIIKRRYAAGEITKEQYENLKSDLKA